MAEPIVRFEHISLQFPDVLANDDVSLDIYPGEVFALVGENGAGKSTLMNVLYGLNEHTGGTLYVKGKRVERQTPDQAISMGVGMVHQHFKLVGSFTVAQNVVLCCEPKKKLGLYDFAKAEAMVRQLSADFGLEIDPQAKVQSLSVGLQQRVEILKTLHRGADILILDEPTAVLTPQETDELFRVIRGIVRDKGMTVIIITHKLNEVMAISDRVGVMRGGKLVGLRDTKDVDERMLASMMVGREVLFSELKRYGWLGRPLIQTEDLHVLSDRMLPAVRGVSLEVRKGEILGIAAIEGTGQSELVEAITGMRAVQSGRAFVDGMDVRNRTPAEVRSLGLAHIPEDHLTTGLSVKSSVEDNLLAGKQRSREFVGGLGHLRRRAIHEYARELFKKFDIRSAGVDTVAGKLSGGNMQKVVIAREFSLDTKALIISQPTRGVDIGAIEFIHKAIVEKRNAGYAILLVSADLDEVFRLSDRIITMFEGRVTGSFRAGEISKEEIGYYMTGARDKEANA